MLWDDSFVTWRALGIPGQPAAMLFTAEGKPLQKWIGPFDLNETLQAARDA